MAPVGSARVMPGSTTLTKPFVPDAGNHPRPNENTLMRTRPDRNAGMAMPSGGIWVTNARIHDGRAT